MAIIEKVDGFFIPNVTLIGVGAAKAIPERIVYLNATKPLLVTDKGIRPHRHPETDYGYPRRSGDGIRHL